MTSPQVLNELGGLAEGRSPAAALQRTADAKATLQWIRSLRENRERQLGPPIKCASLSRQSRGRKTSSQCDWLHLVAIA